MGFEGKPNSIKQTIIEASAGSESAVDLLKKAGKKGGMVSAEKKHRQKMFSEQKRQQLVDAEIEKIKQSGFVNDEGEPEYLSDDEVAFEAEKVVDAILRMKERQMKLEAEKRRRSQ